MSAGGPAAGPTGPQGEEAPAPPALVEVRGRFRAPVVPVAARPDGALDVPSSPDTVGWWALGARPGADRGTVLLAGHVDSRDRGLGAFAALYAVRAGTRVVVTSADGRRYTYVIVARRIYGKEALPPDLFADGRRARLALVTCTGRFDRARHQYTQNLVLLGERWERERGR
ncbi:class F sortase [Streptomyces mashuensis]|uniref:class F sortase n=1 Tax=Streptomyces mashuensis TaxID=33904 RepID=UPI00167DED67|nr:class F sortase [Streptomyces mashuensis]